MNDAYGNEVFPEDVLDAAELTAYRNHERGRSYPTPRIKPTRPVEPWADLLAKVGQA